MPKQMHCMPAISQAHVVPDRTVGASGRGRIKNKTNKHKNPDTQILYPGVQTKTASQGQREVQYTLLKWGAAAAPTAGPVAPPSPLPSHLLFLSPSCGSSSPSFFSASPTLPPCISVPGSLSHTLGERRSGVEQALIYGLTVQSCPEYLQSSSLTSYKRIYFAQRPTNQCHPTLCAV